MRNKHFLNSEVRIRYTFLNKWKNRLGELRKSLSEKETSQLELINNEGVKSRYIITRYLLRQLISCHFNLVSESIEFKTNNEGKPYLVTRSGALKINFNISHSENLLVIGICKNFEIGVDVEKIKSGKEIFDVGKRFFRKEENDFINSLSGEEKLRGFYKIWTMKEALAKAKGISMLSILDKKEDHIFKPDFLNRKNMILNNYLYQPILINDEYTGTVVIGKEENKLSLIEA